MKAKIKKVGEAKVLMVMNRSGVIFKIGDTIKFFGRTFKIGAFRTDSPMPNWLSTHNIAKPTNWIMARQGDTGYWVNIDSADKIHTKKKLKQTKK